MSDILLNSLKEFYMRGDNKKKLLEIINNTNISLRIIDWFVTNYSKKNNIESKIYKYSNKSNAENKILKDLNKKKIDLICLAGFMKILSQSFIKKFKGKILNIHPSLLPKYKGLNTHRRAIKNNDKFSGASVHLVTPKLDSGKIILQKKVRISKTDTEQTLAKKILKIEHRLYPSAIKKILKKSSL